MTQALQDQLVQAMRSLHGRGWCDGTGGNFSCVRQREPLRLLMAPSGVDKGSVGVEQLIEVNDEGDVVGGQGRASAETRLHLMIVETTGAGAVLHTHSQAGTLLSHWLLRSHEASLPSARGECGQLLVKDLEMLKGLEGVHSHAESVRIPVLANDQDLERLSRKARPHLADAPHGLLIAGHGLYAWGKDLEVARRHVEILEWLLEQRWRQLLFEGLGLLGPVKDTPS